MQRIYAIILMLFANIKMLLKSLKFLALLYKLFTYVRKTKAFKCLKSFRVKLYLSLINK